MVKPPQSMSPGLGPEPLFTQGSTTVGANSASAVIRLPRASLHHRTGDLIFCRRDAFLSKLLRAGQHYIDGQPAAYSHVAICIYPGLLMHSIPSGGVQFLPVEQRHHSQITFESAAATGNTVVLRPPYRELPALTALQAMLYWTGQRYNFSFRRPIATTCGRAYCSQLVVQILGRLDFVDEDQFPGLQVTPSALFRYVLARGSEDVTAAYAEYETLLRTDKLERHRLARDLPRIQIVKSAAHTVRQAQANSAVSDAAALVTARNAVANKEVFDRINQLNRTTRSVRTILAEASDHLYGASLVFELLGNSRTDASLHFMDMRSAPLAAMSGMAAHGIQFEIIGEELASVGDRLAWLQLSIEESLASDRGIVDPDLYDSAYATLSDIFEAPHVRFKGYRDAVFALIPSVRSDHASITTFVDRIEAMFRAYDEMIEYYNVILAKLRMLAAIDDNVGNIALVLEAASGEASQTTGDPRSGASYPSTKDPADFPPR